VRFYTEQECEQWMRSKNRQRPDAVQGVHTERVDYPRELGRFFRAAHWIGSSITYRRPALLWITEWGIWDSSENAHLYYRLRQSYGDQRLLQEAPGHLFLGYETEDLTSFLQVCMINGWGGFLVTEIDYVNVFFSHDEYIDFFSGEESNLDEVRKEFLHAT
jgi:hypothetical protein